MVPATTTAEAPKLKGWAAWQAVFRQPFVLGLILARLLTDPVWYFLQFWMPKYLHTVHHLTQAQMSVVWMIFFAADIGFLGGGFFSGRLVKRGLLAPAARLTLMAASACIVPLAFFVPFAGGVTGVIALSMLVAGAATCWLGNLTALVVDVVPKEILGTSFGVIA